MVDLPLAGVAFGAGDAFAGLPDADPDADAATGAGAATGSGSAAAAAADLDVDRALLDMLIVLWGNGWTPMTQLKTSDFSY